MEGGKEEPIKRINKLDETVVNRIAAGEVIQRPANALKEMVENSLDAGSTKINIAVKDGGLKVLQIQDNGHGVHKDDMSLICERFTTSKIKTFSDLKTVSTFGFRGEALASISHVAHVTITSTTPDAQVGYKARYSDGILIPQRPGEDSKPKPIATKGKGTIIRVEDLFYNVSTRRKALKKPTEEFNRIMVVVNHYALHYPKVAFSLRKEGKGPDINTGKTQDVLSTIKLIYGPDLAREVNKIEKADIGMKFSFTAYLSNANYSKKKVDFIVFINNRLVSSDSIKKAVYSVYSAHLPKGTHPFCYISLEMDPKNIDVNVHPTKKHVRFLNEDTIVETIQRSVEEFLMGANTSRTFYSQTTIGGGPVVTREGTSSSSSSSRGSSSSSSSSSSSLSSSSSSSSSSSLLSLNNRGRTNDDFMEASSYLRNSRNIVTNYPSGGGGGRSYSSALSSTTSSSSSSLSYTPQNKMIRTDDREQTLPQYYSPIKRNKTSEASAYTKARAQRSKKYKPPVLSSIQNLLSEIQEDQHDDLAEVFGRHTFVGCVDDEFALIQHRTKLFLCKMYPISKQLMYQEVLRMFSHFTPIEFTNPMPIDRLLILALDAPETGWTESDGSKEEIAEYVVQLLCSYREMLEEYFSIRIDEEGNLQSLPLILDNYLPTLETLPLFLLRLGTNVEWKEEQECFRTLSEELAELYAIRPYSPSDDTEEESRTKDVVETVIFPAVRYCGAGSMLREAVQNI